MLPVLFDPDIDREQIRQKRVAVIGFGNQGHAHAANLRDSGVRVLVGARVGSPSWKRAEEQGFEVRAVADVVRDVDIIMNLAPDEVQAELYREHIAPQLSAGQMLSFGHGFSIHFEHIAPPAEVDVTLVAPVGPGHLLRSRFVEGSGIPCLIAVQNDASGHARAIALAYAAAIGGGRAGVLETTFREECETDLFGEQAVIVGGVARLITMGFEVLVEAGFPEELAYFECAHQMKLLTDLIHNHGIAGMREKISNTARYGDLTRGPRVIDDRVKENMRALLGEITSGAFATEWTREARAGSPTLRALQTRAAEHPIEDIGARIRAIALKPTP